MPNSTRLLTLLLAVTALALSGCASDGPLAGSAQGKTGGEAPAAEPSVAAPSSPGPAESAGGVRLASQVPRRIIYTADVELVTERLGTAEKDLLRLVKAHNGYIAKTAVGGTPGAPRSGTWTVRVPATAFQVFMDALSRLGEVQRLTTDSQDVTEEFTDLEARLGNKRVEERRLLQHLQRSTARLQDILAVERELSRVREEVERYEGRLRFLANQTDLTTITVTVHEVKDYVPPRATSFTAQIGRTFGDSLGGIRDTGKVLLLLVVALAPWAVILLLLTLPLLLFLRRRGVFRPRTG